MSAVLIMLIPAIVLVTFVAIIPSFKMSNYRIACEMERHRAYFLKLREANEKILDQRREKLQKEYFDFWKDAGA